MAIGRVPTLVVATAVGLAATATTAYALTRGHAPRTVAATTATVSRGSVTVTASAAGTVSVVSTRGLGFSTSAVVTELDVKVGDTVSAGQVLARIDSSDAQEAVDAAQQQVTSAQNNLTKAQTPSTTSACAAIAPAAFTAPVALTSPSPSPSPSASLSPPATRGGRPTPSATTARPSRAATCAVGGTGGRSATGDSLATAEQQLNNAQLALLQAQQRLAGTVLTAPLAGKVISVGGTVGSQERPGGTGFIVLGDVRDTEVKAQFSEADVAHLAVGQAATVTIPNHPRPYTGKVAQISPAGTTSGRLVRYGVLVAFDSVPTDLLFGQSANVAVTTAQATDVLCVPSSAVTGVNGSTAAVTVRSGGRDQPRTVTIGLRGDTYTEIKSGLGQGDVVVL
jgi:multidrug efflux pump subunit AcrA (membrane-fusion protein)